MFQSNKAASNILVYIFAFAQIRFLMTNCPFCSGPLCFLPAAINMTWHMCFNLLYMEGFAGITIQGLITHNMFEAVFKCIFIVQI